MSAEMENNKDEETKEPKQPIYRRLLDHWQLGIKFIELIFCITCVILIFEPAETTGLGKTHLHHIGIIYTAFTGYMLINSVLIVGKILKDTLSYKTSVIFSISGAGLFFVSGTLLVSDRSYLTKHMFYPQIYLLDMLTTCTAFSFLNGVIFSIDAILTFKRQEDF